MDLQAKLDEIVASVESARAMPMSASCIVNRTELLGHLHELRELVPSEMHEAQDVLRRREGVVDEGRREAERIVQAARAERARLVGKTEIAQEAAREAERIREQAVVDAERMRGEVDDYVDAKLANFEVVLHKTLRAVERGRAKLRGRTGLEDLGAERG